MTSRLLPGALDYRTWLALMGGFVGVAVFSGIAIGRGSTAGAVAFLILLAVPVMAHVEGGALCLFLGLFPFTWSRQFAGLGADKALGLVCLLVFFLGLLLGKQRLLARLSIVDYAMLVFFAVVLISIPFRTTTNTRWYLLVYAELLALYFVARSVAGNPAALTRSLVAFIAGTVVTGVFALWGFIHGNAIFSQGLDRLSREGVGVNNFASVVLAASAVAIGLALGERANADRLKQMLYWACTAFLILLVVLSLSRGAFVGQLMVIAVAILLLRRRDRALIVVCGLASLILLAPGVAGALGLTDYAQRMQDLVSGGDALQSARTYLWQMALQAIRENPILGLGVGNFTRPDVWSSLATQVQAPFGLPLFGEVHSFFLGNLTDVGLLGGIPLAFAVAFSIGSTAQMMRRESRSAGSTMRGPTYAVGLALVAYFVAASFLPTQTVAIPYMLVGIAQGLKSGALAQANQDNAELKRDTTTDGEEGSNAAGALLARTGLQGH